ncbi:MULTISPECIES: hypothetical protein [Streptomyces]|uniref:DNA-binding HxlR family transcriptional regulator n=1 Tax=Streptomyces stelliscabiei TaxID=146820 RepID=A0A8I0TW20_9ACTN|nr:hypothetical protein [Streptomyces stelliscabiei]MBE1599918.1 DNA-binding HxlR family transcriptional regulator [Streptomyces stelliscabiei]MDX2515913.1 hypothetical protein [Streptomyces stelliscabiei]MDX2549499.1 hypothetical protein [Streptomyces stelliscabiei]MDX2611521.1 hypothetical protein [Streptomyces stelliscabiei]MDX2634383.1 hypothetical protein [Streptomyces stelliscabiei]
MTTTLHLSHPLAGRVIHALSLPALIRLVTEIDDNGPISRRRGSLQSAFGDLTTHQLRYAIDVARTLGLVHADPYATTRYRLTEAGADLAEFYDTAARWSRTHQRPHAVCDFVTRVQHALKLLGLPADAPTRDPADARVLRTEADLALHGLRTALDEWLQTHPQSLPAAAPRSTAAADETELVA